MAKQAKESIKVVAEFRAMSLRSRPPDARSLYKVRARREVNRMWNHEVTQSGRSHRDIESISPKFPRLKHYKLDGFFSRTAETLF